MAHRCCIHVGVVPCKSRMLQPRLPRPCFQITMISDDVNQISFVEHFDGENHSVNDRSSALQ
jgi:hypothetical protein